MKKTFFTVWVFAKTNIRRHFRDRTAIFFTIAFPLIFLLIFGGIFGNHSGSSFNVVLLNKSNTSFAQSFTKDLKSNKIFKLKTGINSLSAASVQMGRGEVDATIILPSGFGTVKPGIKYPGGQVQVYYDENNVQAAQTLTSVLRGVIANINAKYITIKNPLSVVSKPTNQAGLTEFDYIFSGLLGFSIIGLGIFGPVNVFPELKKQGILRRIHITPIRVWQYFVSNVISQSVIGLVSVAIMFAAAKAIFHLKMHGSYLTLAIVVVLGIWMIFGIGLAIGGWAKNENQAAPLANIVVFPLMFLTGVFFPTYLMPEWLQRIATFLPLTPVIDSMRMVITENRSLFQLGPQLGLIAVWAVIIYAIAFKVFRWE